MGKIGLVIIKDFKVEEKNNGDQERLDVTGKERVFYRDEKDHDRFVNNLFSLVRQPAVRSE